MRLALMLSVMALLLMAALPAHASIRCGNQIIDRGASARKVLEYCGKPAVGNTIHGGYVEWIYYFGPDEFMVKVIIENGKVARTETLGPGFIPPGSGKKEAPRSRR